MFILEKNYKLLVVSLIVTTFMSCVGDNKMDKKPAKNISSSASATGTTSGGSTTYANGARVVDGGFTYPVKNGKTSAYYVNENIHKGGYSFGRAPTKNEIKAWNTDVMPDGTGLPEGQGSVELGDEIFEEKCAACHGDFGIGNGGYPKLQGGKGTLANQLLQPEKGDEAPIKTIGSYWPYASTLFWYIQSAMPYPNPKSLSNDETYALVAYLMAINEIPVDGKMLEDEDVLDRKKFLTIKMPNEDGFYPNVDDGVGAKEVTKYLANPENYGAGKRCMSDCKTYPAISIHMPLTNFEPEPSTIRAIPKKKENWKDNAGETLYEKNCAVCHSSPVMGAPVIKDKEAWDALLKKGIENVYSNAINGINAMPPKGGSDLTDEQMLLTVDYLIGLGKK